MTAACVVHLFNIYCTQFYLHLFWLLLILFSCFWQPLRPSCQFVSGVRPKGGVSLVFCWPFFTLICLTVVFLLYAELGRRDNYRNNGRMSFSSKILFRVALMLQTLRQLQRLKFFLSVLLAREALTRCRFFIYCSHCRDAYKIYACPALMFPLSPLL